MRHATALVLLAAIALGSPTRECAAQVAAWPNGHRAAVSLAYDDALASQLDVAVPALDRHGFKASFYLTLASPTVAQRLGDWRALAANGHELGNHSLFHPCSAKGPDRSWVPPYRDLDAMTAPQMQEEVRLANAMLHAIDGRTQRTFTPPCGDRLAGGVDYVAALEPEFVGVRTTAVASIGLTGKQLIALVEAGRDKDTPVNITFHGIDGEHLSTSKQAHDELLDYLAAHRDIYWVDTDLAITSWIRQRKSAQRKPE